MPAFTVTQNSRISKQERHFFSKFPKRLQDTWVVRHRNCYSLPLCSLAEDESFYYYEEGSVKDDG